MVSSNDNHFNCFQAVLVKLCEMYNLDSSVVLTLAVGIMFYKGDEIPFYKRLSSRYVYNIFELFESILLWKVELYETDIKKITMESICKEKDKNHEIILEIDTMYCPWNKSYGKNHGVHYSIVESVNLKKNSIKMIDPFYGKKLYTLDIKEFDLGKKKIISIDIDNTAAVEKQYIFNKIIATVKNNYFKKSYVAFLKSLMKQSSFNNFFECNYLDSCLLIITSNQISNNYYCVMKYLEEQRSEETSLIIFLNNMSKEWSIFCKRLIKIFLKRELNVDSLESLQSGIRKMINYEREFMRRNGVMQD